MRECVGLVIRTLTYKDIDRGEWSRLVQTSATGTWFQTPEAFEFFESMPELFRPFVVGVASLQLPPEGRIEQRGSNSLPFTGEELCSIERPVDARRTSQGVGYSFASVWGAHTADSTQYDLLKENAQANRKNPTEAESILLNMLKGNNIGLHFRRQHIILDYIVDFICIEKGLVIELDGGYHNDPEQAEYDKQRTAHLEKLGYTELRFTNEELLTNPNAVIAQIKEVAFSLPSLQGRAGERLSLPSLKGRGGDRLLLRGVCVGYVTVERNPIKQYFTRRAIIIGGPCLADDCTDEEVNALMNAVKNLPSLQGRDGERLPSPIYIETRNFNDYSRWKGAFEKAGFEYKKHLNFHVDCTDKEQMWERLSKTRQKQIRRAMRSGVEVVEPAEEDVKRWYAILQEMYRQKVKLPLLPMDFFLNAYQSGNAKYLMVKYKGEVIGGLMFEMDEKSVYEWYVCGLDSVYERQYPSVVATYAGMEYANAHGRRCCDLMGAGEPGVPYGVRDFKERFGGQLVEHGRFVCVREPILYKIGTMAVKMMKGT